MALTPCFPAAAGESDGVVLWFTSVLRTKGTSANRPATICVSKQLISWVEGGQPKSLAVPDAKLVAYKPWEAISHTYFGRLWDTSGPTFRAPGDTFLAGVALPLPQGLPRKVSNMTWQARFESDTPGLQILWRWTASAYTRFTDNYNALRVATIDTDLGRAGIAPAGRPLAFAQFLQVHGDAVFTGLGDRGATIVPLKAATCGGIY